jgi:hypothetical protein
MPQHHKLINYKEINGIHQQRRKQDRLRSLRPRSREAGSNTYTTIMRDITKIGTYTKKENSSDIQVRSPRISGHIEVIEVEIILGARIVGRCHDVTNYDR